MGFEPHTRHPVLDCEGHRHRRTRPEFPMSPTRGERIEREGLPEVHHGHDRRTIGFHYLAPPAEKVPADHAGDSDDRDASKHDVSSTPMHPKAARMWRRPETPHRAHCRSFSPSEVCSDHITATPTRSFFGSEVGSEVGYARPTR